jgi:hypothetical protein
MDRARLLPAGTSGIGNPPVGTEGQARFVGGVAQVLADPDEPRLHAQVLLHPAVA